jgi:hypothetical protein
MTKVLQISAIGWVLLSVPVCSRLPAREPPKEVGPAEKLAKDWQLDGFKSLASTIGERIVTREYRSDRPLAELWNAYAAKAGSKEKYESGAFGGETIFAGDSKTDFRFTSILSDDDDNPNSRTAVKAATLCFGTDAGTVVIVLSRGKAESKTFVSLVVVAK